MDILFFTHLLNGLLMIVMPIALAIILTRRFRLGWRLWAIGLAGFIISQIGHIPFNALLTLLFQRQILPAPPESWRPYFNPIVLGLSAGLWEELTRAGIFRWWADDARSWRKAVLLGAGWGGVEAIILGVLVLVSFASMSVMRGMDLSTIIPPEQLALVQSQINAYWSTPWPMSLLGALERALTIPLHIAFSVIVLQAFTRKNPWWVALAVFFHALVNALAVYLVGQWGTEPGALLKVEGVLAVMTAIALVIIFALRQPEPVVVEEVLPVVEPPPAAPIAEPREVTQEDLDRSRYSS